jgi:hypothetical protein
MPPARGDRKPCTEPGCTGVMQYARPAASGTRADDALRWVCSNDESHSASVAESQPVGAKAVSR